MALFKNTVHMKAAGPSCESTGQVLGAHLDAGCAGILLCASVAKQTSHQMALFKNTDHMKAAEPLYESTGQVWGACLDAGCAGILLCASFAK